jgi:NADH-quinone oxidoreductase subunit K
MEITELLYLSTTIFLIAFWGLFVVRKNLILILISLELILLAVSLNFLFFSKHLDDVIGQISALLILSVAGSESAIGLALLVSFYRFRSDISLDLINNLKG